MQICFTNWELWSVKKAEVNSPKGFCSNRTKNARIHTCKIAMDAVERNGYERIPHPAYSPDLAPTISYSQTWKRISVDIISGPTKKSWRQLRSGSETRFWVDGTGTPLVQVHHSRGQLHRKRRDRFHPVNKLGWFLYCLALVDQL